MSRLNKLRRGARTGLEEARAASGSAAVSVKRAQINSKKSAALAGNLDALRRENCFAPRIRLALELELINSGKEQV